MFLNCFFFFFGYLHSLQLLKFFSELNRCFEKKIFPYVHKFALKSAIHSHRFLVSYSSAFIQRCLYSKFFLMGFCYKHYDNEDHVLVTLSTMIQISLGRHGVG